MEDEFGENHRVDVSGDNHSEAAGAEGHIQLTGLEEHYEAFTGHDDFFVATPLYEHEPIDPDFSLFHRPRIGLDEVDEEIVHHGSDHNDAVEHALEHGFEHTVEELEQEQTSGHPKPKYTGKRRKYTTKAVRAQNLQTELNATKATDTENYQEHGNTAKDNESIAVPSRRKRARRRGYNMCDPNHPDAQIRHRTDENVLGPDEVPLRIVTKGESNSSRYDQSGNLMAYTNSLREIAKAFCSIQGAEKDDNDTSNE
mmetsp:Transcript_13733/g.24639  ORF Transcript_13733/g.24639 Transcript_13733/m.24639 type:complete len:255 (-) Transcript_13733:18-782(-)